MNAEPVPAVQFLRSAEVETVSPFAAKLNSFPECEAQALIRCLHRRQQGRPTVVAVVARGGRFIINTAGHPYPLPQTTHPIDAWCSRCTPRRDMIRINPVAVRRLIAATPMRPLRLDVLEVSELQSVRIREFWGRADDATRSALLLPIVPKTL
jgi:hypothetical protein